MLKQRIITAVLLLPIVVVLLFFLSLEHFALALLAVNFLMAWEWARLSGFEKNWQRILFGLSVVLLSVIIWLNQMNLTSWPASSWPNEWNWQQLPLMVYSLTLILWCVAVAFVLFADPEKLKNHFFRWLQLCIGVILLIGFWISMISLRHTENLNDDSLRGGWILLYMMMLIWAADIGGYIFGRLWGRHKIAPVVSPGKTWEGFSGSVLLSTLVAFIGIEWLSIPVTHFGLFFLTIFFIVIIALWGDLFESLLKRRAHLKDSSQLLPGHGGLLDRMDSSLAVAPFFLLLSSWMEWF